MGGGRGRKIIDISRPLSPGTAPWPGDEPFLLEWRWRLRDGKPVNLSALRLSPHSGTHADAPLHVIDGQPGIGEVGLDPFVGPARVVEASVLPGAAVGPASLEGLDLSDPPRILLKTGTNDDPEKWNPGFAGLEERTARALVDGGAKLVGLDTPGVDPPDSIDLAAHRILAAGGLRWIENLDLRGVEPGLYELIALPLRIVGGDASPVRAILIRS
ncbi:MAG: cyclase family protein [Candidatus Eisenbacteria bacterium]